MRFNGTTIPTHRDETYDTSEVSRYPASSGGDIEVEALAVTENGTYIAPEGKAYSPVNVNVAGGGGSSDFSIAEVTIVNTINGHVTLTMPVCGEGFDEGAGSIPPVAKGAFSPEPNSTTTVNVIMYKGATLISDVQYFEVIGDISCSGDIDDGLITGNGTITIIED